MAHFAHINSESVVDQVIVAEQDFIDSGILGDPSKWVQTSYNTSGGKHFDPETGEPDDGFPLRKNYAGIGFSYDSIRDAFIPPKPFDSWLLDEFKCIWYSPIPYPTDGLAYAWDESIANWKLYEPEII